MIAHAFLQMRQAVQVVYLPGGGRGGAHAGVPAVEGLGEADEAAAREAGDEDAVVVMSVVGEEGWRGGGDCGVGGPGRRGRRGIDREGRGALGESDGGVYFGEVDFGEEGGEVGLRGGGGGCQGLGWVREGGGVDGEVEEIEEAGDGGDGGQGEGRPGAEVADVPPKVRLHAPPGGEGEVADEVDGLGGFGEVSEEAAVGGGGGGGSRWGQ